MKTANSGLQAIEYLFIAISMVGIAIATFTQEVTYAAIPLMIAVLLSLFNRQEVEANIILLEKKLLEKEQGIPNKLEDESASVNYSEAIKILESKSIETEGAIAQLKQDSVNVNDLKSQVTGFQERFERFSSVDLSPLQAQITSLQEHFERLDQTNYQDEFSQLKTKFDELQTILGNLQEGFKGDNSLDLSPLQQEITNLWQQIDNLTQLYPEITQIKQKQETLEGNLQELKIEVNQVLNLIQSLPSRSELEELKQLIDSLSYLKTEVNNFVNWDSFNSLSGHVNNLVEQFNYRPEAQKIQDLSESLSNLNFKEIEEQIKHLREQFEAIPQKNLLDTLNHQGNELNQIKQKLETEEEEKLSSQSRMNPELRKRILKPKPRRIRINQRRR